MQNESSIRFSLALGTLLWTSSIEAHAQPELLPASDPQRGFAGRERNISAGWRNQSQHALRIDVRTRLSQASSSTVAPLQQKFWKKLEMLPGQTILDSATFDFPLVRAETPFVIQWIEGTNHVLGVTEVLVYPPDLLKELATLAGQKLPGVFDPADRLKPLLKSADVDFFDFELSRFDNFEPLLAIIGPFESKVQMREGLSAAIKALARKGTAVVWLQPPPDRHDVLKPSFYTVPEGKGTVVVAQSGLVANLADDPRAQLNLIRLCRQALRPEAPGLPDLVSQP